MSKGNKKAKPEISVKSLKKHFRKPSVESIEACSCGGGLMEKMYQKLQELADSVEIIAREIERQSNSRK